MKHILEGLREGDLEDIVLPLISVDEYQSKIDDEAIVFAFFVKDQDGAKDLNRFIQKSPASLLDTDISPAPNQKGYYLVFVELLKNDLLPKTIETILEEVSPLVGIEHWNMRVRGVDKLLPVTRKLLAKHFGDKEQEAVAESVTHYLTKSDLSDVETQGRSIDLVRDGRRMSFDLVEYKEADDHALFETPTSLTFADVALLRRLEIMLGEGWVVGGTSDSVMLRHRDENNIIILRHKS